MIFKLHFKQEQEDIKSESLLSKTISVVHDENNNFKPLKIQIPKDYKGMVDDKGFEIYYTPEELFLAGVSGCFYTTFSYIANNSKFNYEKLEIKASLELGREPSGKIVAQKISQDITLFIKEEKLKNKGMRLLQKAEELCPLGNSVKVELTNTYNVNII
ncbi:MAG: OsmC family protein [Promethearchaeota archaeon]